jgi:hypothetical protein
MFEWLYSEKLYIWIMSNENIKLISDLIDYIDVNNSTCNTYKLDQIRSLSPFKKKIISSHKATSAK